MGSLGLWNQYFQSRKNVFQLTMVFFFFSFWFPFSGFKTGLIESRFVLNYVATDDFDFLILIILYPQGCNYSRATLPLPLA